MTIKPKHKKQLTKRPAKISAIKPKSVSFSEIQGIPADIPVEQIDFSPLNYRKNFRQQDLTSFAEELKQHGIISPLTVRHKETGRFELVTGERRLRAAYIAGLKSVPVMIKPLTDEQVTEIQLAENLQRENPHPMHEAQGIALMRQTGKNMDEIAARLGKSTQSVYVRLKLLALIADFQEMFLADKLTLQDAVEIAAISPEGQEHFYKERCSKWREKNFQLTNLHHYLRNYRCDLLNAPFNFKDKNLVPEAGACSSCSYNTATLKSLFPEYAKTAICSNAACYENKCSAHLRNSFVLAINEYQPVALLFDDLPSPAMQSLQTQVKEAEALKKYDCNEVTVVIPPVMPDKDDFTDDYSGEDDVFDEEGYNDAMQDYENEKAEYQILVESGNLKKAVIERDGQFFPALFSPEPPPRIKHNHSGQSVTMKSLQEALKSGTATAPMLQDAIDGMLEREERAKELDKNKVQLTVHKEFSECIADIGNNKSLTSADHAAAMLIIFQSLNWDAKRKVEVALFPGLEKSHEKLFQRLKALSEQEQSYLIRIAISSQSDSKNPALDSGYFLYKMAEELGLNVEAIELAQQDKADSRAEKTLSRINELDKKKAKLAKRM